MSRAEARYEVVRRTGGWFVRFISANNRIVWVTPGFHNRKVGSEKAIESITGEPLRRALISGRTKALSGRGFVEVRYVDERPLTPVERPTLPPPESLP